MEFFVFAVRCLIVLLATWLVTNFIGKKSIAQLTPYDLAILFVISNVAAQPLVNKDSFKTAAGMIFMGLCLVVIAKLSLHRWFYKMDFTPSILIAKGVIDKKELRKNSMNLHMLLSQLRVQGYFQVSDVEYAILEAGGDLSILPKSTARPVTPDDLKLSPQQEGLSYAVIIDGYLMKDQLQAAGVNEDWLEKQLKSQHGSAIKNIFYAEVNDQKQLFVSGSR
ncbi:DUF421 domain-containing protein [Paenibacillus sp. CF384]|uniref:DUF421 domain-containing protein n=1 Tax=Paenibacillus sp. CF384 TaxID=1884382 RepID=UPI000897120A|nr:DUF421 domain-containing protein [Paenibacillus sp. CF384]SDX55718.1 Uncharacterized membrane protein YcaP, DUF421 family [Paenibacillus sp. CF384]